MKRTFADFEDKEKVACYSPLNELCPDEVAFSSHLTCIFTCNKCDEDFSRVVQLVTDRGAWCPCCSTSTICLKPGCEICYKKSFEYQFPDKAKHWSDKNRVQACRVRSRSNKKYIFDCECGHEFVSALAKVAVGKWCPYCSGNKLCLDSKNCFNCFSRSFASFEASKVSQWSDIKNDVSPHQVAISSSKKYWFDCKECNHSFEAALKDVVQKSNWCAFCANLKRCKDVRNCETCFSKTFASFEDKDKVRSWSASNKLKPYDVAISSNSIALFDCYKCTKTFKSFISSVTSSQRVWCPHCAHINKNMESLETLFSRKGFSYDKETPVKLNNRNLRWDMVVTNESNVFFIESDGRQHFSLKGIMNINRDPDKYLARRKFIDQRTRDLLKEDHIEKTNGLLFRVSYRQLKVMNKLVDEMIEKSNSGLTGVVYMDEELYKDWGPIPNENE